MLPVVNTFIEFRPQPRPRRSSCPAEFFADLVIEKALKREKARAKKRSARVVRKWSNIVEAAWKSDQEKTMKEIRALPRVDKGSPKFRCALDLFVYPYFVRRVFPDVAHALLLETMGVIRREAATVQFWVADVFEENDAMQQIIAEARRMQAVREDGCIQISAVDRVPMVFPWRRSLTLESIRKTCERHFGVPACRQRLTLLGTPLRRGRLEDQGVGHGSVIELE